MLINRKNFDRLEGLDLTEIGCVYICPLCLEMSSILPKTTLIEEILCIKCSGVMELIMIEVPDEEKEEK